MRPFAWYAHVQRRRLTGRSRIDASHLTEARSDEAEAELVGTLGVPAITDQSLELQGQGLDK